jgi:hypothetical protein
MRKPFQRFWRARSKPLKRLIKYAPRSPGLKPGVNEKRHDDAGRRALTPTERELSRFAAREGRQVAGNSHLARLADVLRTGTVRAPGRFADTPMTYCRAKLN